MKFSLDSSIAFYIILLVEWMKYCHLIANHSFEQLKHSLISKNVGGAPCYCDGKCDLLNVLSVFFFQSAMVVQHVPFHICMAGGMFEISPRIIYTVSPEPFPHSSERNTSEFLSFSYPNF